MLLFRFRIKESDGLPLHDRTTKKAPVAAIAQALHMLARLTRPEWSLLLAYVVLKLWHWIRKASAKCDPTASSRMTGNPRTLRKYIRAWGVKCQAWYPQPGRSGLKFESRSSSTPIVCFKCVVLIECWNPGLWDPSCYDAYQTTKRHTENTFSQTKKQQFDMMHLKFLTLVCYRLHHLRSLIMPQWQQNVLHPSFQQSTGLAHWFSFGLL